MPDLFRVVLEGKQYTIPYRTYEGKRFFDRSQQALCDDTRHHDGFVREKNLLMLLKCKEIHYASLPYILKLAEEYVLEITKMVNDNLHRIPEAMWKDFLGENPKWLDIMECRCISYWDCYYRRVPITEAILMTKGGYRLHPEWGIVYFDRNDYPGIQAVNYLRSLVE